VSFNSGLESRERFALFHPRSSFKQLLTMSHIASCVEYLMQTHLFYFFDTQNLMKKI